MKKQILLNPDNSGADICRTIKHSYNGCMANLIRTSTFGQTGVLEIYTMQELTNTDSNGNDKAIRAFYGKCGFDSVFRGGGQGITGVMEEIEPKMMQLVGDRCNPSVSVKETAFTVCSTPMSDRGQMVMEPKIAASRGRGKDWQQQLEINESGTSYTITSVNKDNLLMEPNVLRAERTEQCKHIRKMNGDKGMKFNQGNREYNPRTDGVSNTLSTSVKDNMLAVPELRMEDGCMVDKEGRRYRIRKLTPTECFRLQDVIDEDIEKIRSYVDSETEIICDANGEPIMNMDFDKPSKNARKITITVNGEQREYYSSQLIWKNKGKGISKTAQYKLAGNSICVAPMYHIFRKLFIEKECESNQLSLF